MKSYIPLTRDALPQGQTLAERHITETTKQSCPWSPLQANMSMSNPSDVTGTWPQESYGRNGLVLEMVMMVEIKQAICNKSSWMEF